MSPIKGGNGVGSRQIPPHDINGCFGQLHTVNEYKPKVQDSSVIIINTNVPLMQCIISSRKSSRSLELHAYASRFHLITNKVLSLKNRALRNCTLVMAMVTTTTFTDQYLKCPFEKNNLAGIRDTSAYLRVCQCLQLSAREGAATHYAFSKWRDPLPSVRGS